ncbi:MAG: hypothetical protein JNJ65_10215 [Cyclobacteriaceae bacterium]|nr:hypothetical protein [Cyclobacteriaceae bacterium]
MNFEEYLITKKIDSSTFRQAEPVRWHEWNELFDQMSSTSFTSQKLYLINPVRRKYPLKQTAGGPASTPVAAPKPIIKPKPKIN